MRTHSNVRRHSPRAIVAWSAACVLLITATAAHAGTTTVVPERVSAGIFFDGATLVVRGTVNQGSHVVVRVIGPDDEHTYNRRGKIGGLIWGGIEHVSFRHAPSVYAVYTTAALRSIADPAARAELVLGYDSLAQRIGTIGGGADARVLVDHLIQLKEREGLYHAQAGGVQFEDARDGQRHFRLDIPVPATVPPGDLEVTVFEFEDGKLLEADTAHVEVDRVGLPAALFTLAHTHGFLFGLLAVAVSIATGLGTGLVANRRRPSRIARAAGTGAATEHLDAGGPETPVVGVVLRSVRHALSPHAFGPPPSHDLAVLRARYHVFRDLLRVNNEVLGLLAELEEESSWTSFSRPRVRTHIRALFDGTADMVKLLNELTSDAYFDLLNVVSGIRRDVMAFLSGFEEEEEPLFVLQLNQITSANAAKVGGKAHNLARLECDLAIRVPQSFVVTTDAYRLFLEQNDLGGKLRAVLAPARLEAPVDFRRRCELAQALVDETEVPPAVIEAIGEAWRAAGFANDETAALRSSAAGEDSELSFAGQFESLLNVPHDEIAHAWRRVVRSRFAPRAVFYRRASGLAEVDTPMAVLVQRMVRPVASGVIFTRRPDDPKASVLLLASTVGLGLEVSGGTGDADELVVSRREPGRVLERRIARKRERVVPDAAGGVSRVPVDDSTQLQPSVNDEQVAVLAEKALSIERYFGQPQDIEWALDEEGEPVILQARPLRTSAASQAAEPVPTGAPLLLRGGDPVCTGRAVGAVFVMASPGDEERVPHGCILVVSQLLPDCVQFLPRISGLIVDHGTVTGHAASIVREFRVPSLFGIEAASRTLVTGQVVSLDVFGRSVYAGALWPELQGQLPTSVVGRQAIGLPRVLASKLTRLSGSAFVSSWACQSLHDVIRYAHEMAILAMFDTGDSLLQDGTGVKRVEGSNQYYVHVVDLGGGTTADAANKRTITCDQITSRPFCALWRGMTSEEFPRPPVEAVQGRSLAALLANTITPGTRALGFPNYACVTDTYVNLNSRQAYHYAVVDAFLSDTANSNHVSVRLKGGGAAAWQRNLRARFMCNVLRLHGFVATATGDVLNAWCRGIGAARGEQLLTTVGRVLRFSGQLDLLMDDEASVEKYLDAFTAAEREVAADRTVETPA